MTTAATAEQTPKATFTLIPGGKARQEPFITATWIIAQSILWNHHQFTEAEISKFKKLITDHYQVQPNTVRCFKDLAERICLARRYVMRYRSRYVARPIDWLNINYGKGLSGTAEWLNRVNEQRTSVPSYEQGIATFAAALMSFVQSPDRFDFINWRKKLIKQQQYELLQLFSICMSNLNYLQP